MTSAAPPPSPRRPRGRPRGPSSTKDALLAAARAEFAASGYDAATLRRIADRAEVDPAMIRHHFGSKEGLFTAAMRLPFDPGDYIEQVLTGPLEDVGLRLATVFLTMWDEAGSEPPTAMLRTAMQHDWAMRELREFLIERVLRRGFTRSIGWDQEAQLRASLVASQLLGLLVVRYVARFEPLASLPVEQAAAAIAPNLQHYLTGSV